MKYSQKTLHSSPERARYGVSFVSSNGNILCRLVKIELYKIFAIIIRAIKGLHCIDKMWNFDTNLYISSYPIKSEKFYFMFVKISLNVINYLLRNHELIKKWLWRPVRAWRTRGLAPIVPLFGRIEHRQMNPDTDGLTKSLRPFTFMGYQTTF